MVASESVPSWPAQFPSRCWVCYEDIAVGDLVVEYGGDRVHARCPEPEGVVLAVVGSTAFEEDPDATRVATALIVEAFERLQPSRVVSGGAVGIDRLAAALARARGIEVVEHLPRNRRWAPEGYEERNLLIARECTHLLSIRHSSSRTYGSGWTADRAEELGRHVERHMV